MSSESDTAERQEPDHLAVRHLIVALERITSGRLRDAQKNLEYARSRLAWQTQWMPTTSDLGFGLDDDERSEGINDVAE